MDISALCVRESANLQRRHLRELDFLNLAALLLSAFPELASAPEDGFGDVKFIGYLQSARVSSDGDGCWRSLDAAIFAAAAKEAKKRRILVLAARARANQSHATAVVVGDEAAGAASIDTAPPSPR